MTYEIQIKGNPIAKKRPRFARRGKFVAVINDQENEEGRFLWEVRQQYRGLPPLEGPLCVTIFFCLSIPGSTSKTKASLMATGEILPTKRPDLDNCIKFVLDCLNGEIWEDDKQITSLQAKKFYGPHSFTKIMITEVWEGKCLK